MAKNDTKANAMPEQLAFEAKVTPRNQVLLAFEIPEAGALNFEISPDNAEGMAHLILQAAQIAEVTFIPVAGLPPVTVPAWSGCFGLEPDPWMFVGHMVAVFRLVRELLPADGTCWVNMGDSYATGAGKVGDHPGGGKQGAKWAGRPDRGSTSTAGYRCTRRDSKKHVAGAFGPLVQPNRMPQVGLKPKDLVMMPARIALALQADGWYLRQDIIWHKPNPMPESIRDRCTKAHEYVFLLAKSKRYYWDREAMQEGAVAADIGSMDGGAQREADGSKANAGRNFRPGKSGNTMRKQRPDAPETHHGSQAGSVPWEGFERNRRTVWTVPTHPFKGAHFATFPPALIEPCILASTRPADVVLDPFFGSGTTGQVAQALGRQWVGVELQQQYGELQQERTRQGGLAL